VRSSDDLDQSRADDPKPSDQANVGRRRPTWRELAFHSDDVPLDESIVRASARNDPDDSKIITLTGTAQPRKPSLLGRWRGSGAADAAQTAATLCRFDSRDRRLVDFRLPTTDGKLVSFHEFKADLIVLDFWGSWCKQCGPSVDHLTELQAKLSNTRKRVQVIGIACENGSSLNERQASAADAVRRLKINYPVLVSSMDGSCPVQKGMQVHFYPTMILLDRDGRVIQRAEGATDATLARMDRAIATALK
jgi:peroxiredoxin